MKHKLKQLCPIPINVNNKLISFLDDSFNKQGVAFDARDSEYARIMQDMNQQYDMPDDKMQLYSWK